MTDENSSSSRYLDSTFMDVLTLTTASFLAAPNGSTTNGESTDNGSSPALNPSRGAGMSMDDGEKDQEEMSVVFYVMLSIFVVIGSVGNALAIYVFASLKQKLTSTIFILTLAGTDFLTCVLTIPFTMFMEHANFNVNSDFVCKMYNFLVTTTVPFSAVVMVAIAFDRYMCICHPFHHWMTIQRARIIIGILLVFVSFYGIIISMHYSIHWPLSDNLNVTHPNGSAGTDQNNLTDSLTLDGLSNSTSYIVSYITGNSNSSVVSQLEETVVANVDGPATTLMTRTKVLTHQVKTNECLVRWDYIDAKFMKIFRNMYFVNFALSCAIVLILYSLIYRYVISQRKKKLRIKSAQCCLLWNARSIENHHESVEITQDIELSNVNGDRYNARLMSNDEAATAAENHNNGSTRKCSISKARIERMRVANIKTAFTLFIVNVVFIISFLPAWLMVMGFLEMRVIIFYMHFAYNVCNPLIYAFLNQNFKAELERILRCGQV